MTATATPDLCGPWSAIATGRDTLGAWAACPCGAYANGLPSRRAALRWQQDHRRPPAPVQPNAGGANA